MKNKSIYSPETAQDCLCIHILNWSCSGLFLHILVMGCRHLPRVVLSGLRVHVSVVRGVQVRNGISVL